MKYSVKPGTKAVVYRKEAPLSSKSFVVIETKNHNTFSDEELLCAPLETLSDELYAELETKHGHAMGTVIAAYALLGYYVFDSAGFLVFFLEESVERT